MEKNPEEELLAYISAIVQVTADCNLKCKYCYMENGREKVGKKIMDLETVENIVNKLTKTFRHVALVWHGGEPLLPGLNFYRGVVDIENQCKNSGKITNRMQTNATLAHDDLIDFLTKNGFKLGTSLDGPSEINDTVRQFCSGDGATRSIENGMKIIQKYQNIGAVCVVSKQNADAAEKIYQNLKDKKIEHAKLQPYNGADSELKINNQSFFKFHKQIYDLLMNDSHPMKSVSPISDIIERMLGGKEKNYGGSTYLMGGCFSSNLVIDVNGNVYPCVMEGMEEYKLGNIKTSSAEEIFHSEIRKASLKKYERLQSQCKDDCEYFYICQGGCMQVNLLSGREMFSRNYFCSGKRELFSYIADDLERRLSSLLEKKGLIRKADA